jgi:hypothetical protein
VWYKQKYQPSSDGDVGAVWASSAPIEMMELYTGADLNTLNAVNRMNESIYDVNYPKC